MSLVNIIYNMIFIYFLICDKRLNLCSIVGSYDLLIFNHKGGSCFIISDL